MKTLRLTIKEQILLADCIKMALNQNEKNEDFHYKNIEELKENEKDHLMCLILRISSNYNE